MNDMWVVLIYSDPDPMKIETCLHAVGPFYEGEAALIYVRESQFMNCQIKQLCSAPGVNESPIPGPRIVSVDVGTE